MPPGLREAARSTRAAFTLFWPLMALFRAGDPAMGFTLSSGAFHEGGRIPEKYSRKGGNISPPLAWSGVPASATTLALIVDDPDAPSGVFVHWLLYRIPATVSALKEHLPDTPELPDGSRQGRNGFGGVGYGGPQPPSGTHRYVFHLYALDFTPDLAAGASRDELQRAMRGHILQETELVGRYGNTEGAKHAR
jgi:Raf kinase inhibitor-like YbhB/YbcL family protein